MFNLDLSSHIKLVIKNETENQNQKKNKKKNKKKNDPNINIFYGENRFYQFLIFYHLLYSQIMEIKKELSNKKFSKFMQNIEQLFQKSISKEKFFSTSEQIFGNFSRFYLWKFIKIFEQFCIRGLKLITSHKTQKLIEFYLRNDYENDYLQNVKELLNNEDIFKFTSKKIIIIKENNTNRRGKTNQEKKEEIEIHLTIDLIRKKKGKDLKF
ncbi:sin3b-related [Anaeramoeba ignava]|uniref:Sin3b-related n=1 Tax=Anaeramoeba ignava TaxID=1746090 RepID=A0A9Q0LPR6_ANAIG|nr:sin3b-related [Anaeramoeba ignava]